VVPSGNKTSFTGRVFVMLSERREERARKESEKEREGKS